jgi:hypothetical protein
VQRAVVENVAMAPGDTVLIDTSSIAQVFPTWWTPSPASLASITPGGTHVKLRAVTIEADGGADLSTARSLWVAVDGVEADSLRGTIEVSNVDRDGFREGDRIETTADRVWDLFQIGVDGRPELNEDRARAMVGKTVLVGITKEARSRRKPPEQSQIVGTIENIDSTGIRLRLRDGSVYSLPPDIRPFESALPGEYRLRSTGEVITDPDFTCTWVSAPRLQAL